MSALAAFSLAVLWLYGSQVLAQSPESEPNAEAIRVDITIKARQFHPSPVSVSVGREVVLIFNNQDVELHAFVPTRFLEGVPLHVDGNGAPQFGERGLERVLIPSRGREAIHPSTQEAMAVKPWRNAQRVSSEALAKEDMLRRVSPKKPEGPWL